MAEQTELNTKIAKQIEYYFGDVNISRDNFLKDLLGKEDGWVEIKTLLTFNRLKAMTEQESAVAEAIRSVKSELVELNEEGNKIRRITPLPVYDEEYKKTFKLRTVHIKGFPKDSTLDDIQTYCSQFGDLEGIQMRRFKDKSFKGCIFAIYKTIEGANKAIAEAEKYGENTMLRENKEDYFKRKAEFKVKKENRLANLNKGADGADENQAEEPKEVKFETGCILKLHGLPENVAYNEIKQAFNEHSKVEYVEVFADKNEAIVRFASNKDLATAVDKLKSAEQEATADSEEAKPVKVTFNGNNVESSVLAGDEETDYWRLVQKIRSQFTHKAKINKNNKFGKGLKYKNKNKRKGGRDDASSKKQKIEA